jgi:hypothetical protein
VSRIRLDRQLLLKVLIFCGISFYFVSLLGYNFIDIDLWHEMALIRESVAAGNLLKTDVYSFSPTLPVVVDHEWGAGAVAYFSTIWFGNKAVIALKYGIGLAILVICWNCAERIGADLRLFGPCALLAIYLGHLGFLPAIRAQVYSFLFTAILLCGFELDRHGNRSWPWICLILFPLWVNLHAGFVVGIGLVCVYAAEQLLRRKPVYHLALLAFAMTCEILINPYGTLYFRYLWRALTMSRPYVPEWNSVITLGPYGTAAFVLALALAGYGVLVAGWKNAPGFLLLLATALEAALHRKLLPFFAITWLAYVPAYLQRTPTGKWVTQFYDRRFLFVRAAWFAACVISLTAAAEARFWQVDVPAWYYPVGVVEYLGRSHFRGNMIVPFRLGAYVAWKLYPEVKVSVDSRYEVAYPDSVSAAYFRFYDAGEDWRSTLVGSGAAVALIPLSTAVAKVMPRSGWDLVYADPVFQLYSRPDNHLPVVNCHSCRSVGTFP